MKSLSEENVPAIASAVVCAVNVRIHSWGVIAAKLIEVDSNFLSYPVPLFLFQICTKCNHLICSW